MNTQKSHQLFERALKIAPGGVHSPVRSFRSVGGEPIFFAKAQGCHLIDADGNQHIDFCQSFGPLILGHRDPDVEQAVKSMLETAWTFGACEPYSLELAEFIVGEVPWVEKIRFVSSGTEAVMSALRLARAFTGRKKILKFDGCYHGHWDALLVKAGSGLAGESSTDSAGIPASWAKETLVAPLDDESIVQKIFAEQGADIAALVIEPLPANYGLLVQRTDYLKKITEIARAAGSLIIWDEVISGFRLGLQGMAGAIGVKPDLVTYGKIIGGGFPVGAFGGRSEIMDQLAPLGPVYQAGTLSGNPIGMRAGLTSLKKLKEKKIHASLKTKTSEFCQELSPILQKHGMQVINFESLFWIHLQTKDPSGQPKQRPIRRIDQIPEQQKSKFGQLFHSLLQQGIYLAPSGFEVCFLSAAHDDAALEKTISAFKKSLS